ncbi:MAG: hypothetical protein MJ131_07935 [Lachnospiraceae bacterium]|nr:hypothetical protein [Lachnospiraceae bacterium]
MKKYFTKAVIIALIAGIVLTGTFFGLKNLFVQAVLDDSNAIHIQDSDIDNSTIIIGSHLIYLPAMTDAVYSIAVSSVSESNQGKRYYKSELAGGVWYDITDASSLADITSGGVPVSKDVIEGLLMTHHTKPDGITYDLVTGEPICIFDISNPYDLLSMPELEPIKTQYKALQEKDEDSKTDTDKRDLQLLDEMFNAKPQSDGTDYYDEMINALQGYYSILAVNNAEQKNIDRVQNVMQKFDNARRLVVFDVLSETILENLSNCVGADKVFDRGDIYVNRDEEVGLTVAEQNKRLREEYMRQLMELSEEEAAAIEEPTYKIVKLESFTLNTSLNSSIGDAMQNISESSNECSANLLETGEMVLTQLEFELSTNLAKAAKSGNFSECDKLTAELLYLDSINAGIIAEAENEYKFIEEKLIERERKQYSSQLSMGTGADYKKLPSTAAAVSKSSVLKKQKSELEAYRAELQKVIQAEFDRMAPKSAIEYCTTLIEQTDEYYDVILSDAYEPYATESVDEYLAWLKKSMNELQALGGGGELADLLAEKEKLQTELESALDKNNINKEKKLRAQLEAIDKAISDETQKLTNIINSDSATPAEKAVAESMLGAGTAADSLKTVLEGALNDIRDGSLGSAADKIQAIGALSGMVPGSAFNALKDIYKELSKQMLTNPDLIGDISEVMALVEDVTADNMDSFLATGITEDDLADAISDFADQNGMEFGNGSGLNGQGGSGSGSEGQGGSGSGSDGQGDGSGSDGQGDGSGSDSQGDGSGSDSQGDGSGSEGQGDGSGSDGQGGSGSASGVNADSLMELLAGLSDGDAAKIIVGMNMYTEATGCEITKGVVSAYARKNIGTSRNLYKKPKDASVDSGVTYIPTTVIARLAGYRYIFNDPNKKVTLQKRSDYFVFNAFSKAAERNNDQIDYMNAPAVFYETVYIDTDYSEASFGEIGVYLSGCDYGIAVNESEYDAAFEFYDYLIGIGL